MHLTLQNVLCRAVMWVSLVPVHAGAHGRPPGTPCALKPQFHQNPLKLHPNSTRIHPDIFMRKDRNTTHAHTPSVVSLFVGLVGAMGFRNRLVLALFALGRHTSRAAGGTASPPCPFEPMNILLPACHTLARPRAPTRVLQVMMVALVFIFVVHSMSFV